MNNLPKGWHIQADDTIVCPHRDLSVCPDCASAHPEAVEVLARWYWVEDEAERTDLQLRAAAAVVPR